MSKPLTHEDLERINDDALEEQPSGNQGTAYAELMGERAKCLVELRDTARLSLWRDLVAHGLAHERHEGTFSCTDKGARVAMRPGERLDGDKEAAQVDALTTTVKELCGRLAAPKERTMSSDNEVFRAMREQLDQSSAPPAPAPASTPPVPKSEPASREDLRSLGRLVGYAFNSAGYVVNMTPTDEPVHNVEEQRGAALLSYLRSVKPALLNSISEPSTAELRERLSATEGALGSLQDAMVAQSRMHAAVVKRLNDALESQTKRAMNAETMNAHLRQNEPEQVAALKDEVWRLEDSLARVRTKFESGCLVDLRMVSTGALSGAMLGACQTFCASSEPAFRSWLIEKAGVKL